MEEEIDKALRNVTKTIEEWDAEEAVGVHTPATAQTLELQLSFLKLIIGIDRFDELPAYSRYLRQATKFLDEKYSKETK